MVSSVISIAVRLETTFEPAYLELSRSGELDRRALRAVERLASCDLCARYCRIDRLVSTRGAVCRTGRISCSLTFTPRRAICQAASLPASPPPTTVTPSNSMPPSERRPESAGRASVPCMIAGDPTATTSISSSFGLEPATALDSRF